MNSLDKLAHEFAKLPGVGAKTAMRYAYAVMGMSAEDAEEFSRAITDVKTKVHYCRECGNFTEDDVCDICRRRSKDVICVVTYPKDVIAMEKSHCFGGVYHVLHGTISPLSGVKLSYRNSLCPSESVGSILLPLTIHMENTLFTTITNARMTYSAAMTIQSKTPDDLLLPRVKNSSALIPKAYLRRLSSYPR